MAAALRGWDPADAALLVLPAALTVYLGLNAGGFFVGATGVAAVALALVLVVRTILAERPFAGIGWLAAAAAAALALYAAWTLLSGLWSNAPARALLEFDRVLLYLLALVLFASVPQSSARLGRALRSLSVGIVVVCVVGLATRVAPDIWSAPANIQADRLSYPLTYWNALGLLAAIGIAFCFHLAASEREPRVARVLGAGALPILGVTLLLTFSRGAIAVAAAALVAYAVFGRPRGLVSALTAAGPPTAVALAFAYGAEAIATTDPTGPAAVAQGHELALATGLCALAAALLRLLLLRVDAWLSKLRLPDGARLPAIALGIAVPILAVAALALSLDAAGYVERQLDAFAEAPDAQGDSEVRSRLTRFGSPGRLDHWEVALDGFDGAPLRGSGAGTYELLWARERETPFTVNDAHSLYLEVLAELGVVGLALIAAALLVLLGGIAARARGEQRHVYGALLAAGIAWVLHAGVDWDWEVPAVTAWLFALGGLALASRKNAPGPGLDATRSRGRVAVARAVALRALVIAGLLVLALIPARAALSQEALDRGIAALEDDRCEEGVDAALASISVLAVRPEPWEVLGYCDVRLGATQLALRAFENAVERDPDNWEVHYGLALGRAAAGIDPRSASQAALMLNPRSELTQEAQSRLAATGPAGWKRWAMTAPLPLP